MKKWKTTLGILCAAVVLCSACGNKNMAKGTAPASSGADQALVTDLIYSMHELSFDTSNVYDMNLCQNVTGVYGLQCDYASDDELPKYKIIKLGVEGLGQTIDLANDNNGDYSHLAADDEGCFYVHQSVIDADDVIVKFSSDGNKLWESPINEEDSADEYGIQNLIYAKKVGVVSLSNSGVSIFDTESGKESRISSSVLDEYSNGDYSRRSILGLRDGNMYLLQTNAQMNDILYKYDPATNDFSTVDGKYLQEALEGSALYPGKNYDFLVNRIDGIYAFNLEDDKGTKLCDYNASDLMLSGISYIAEAGDNSFLVSAFDITDGKMDSHYCLLSKGSAEESEDKQTLTIAVNFASDDIRRAVSAFNKESSDYKAVIKDYYSGQSSYMGCIESMNLDIISGNGPDIMVVSSDMPFDSYVNKGLIEPLDEYFNSDTELAGQKYLENVLNLGRRNGTLYTIIPKFAVQTCIADAGFLGDEVVSFSNYKELCKQRDIDPSMLMGELTKEDAGDIYALGALGFVDIENNTCDFNNQGFYQLLEFVSGLPESAGDEPETTIYRDKKAILLPVQIYDMDEYVWAKKGFFDGDVVYNGMPTVEGGETFIEVPFQVAMSSTCKDKAAAWEFIRSLLTEEYQNGLQLYFPISEAAFEQKLKDAQQDKSSYVDGDGHLVEVKRDSMIQDGVEVEIEPINEEEAKQFYELVKATSKSNLWDEAIVSIISEEVEVYLAGQKSAEEVADIIQNRVSIYLNESK